MQPVGEALGVAHEPRRARILADADENALARRPGPGNGVGLHLGEQLLVDALGGAAQRQLAQRGQIAGREEMLQRALGLFRHIDLAVLQPLDQVVGRQVDQLDGVGAVEHGIRHGLAHADMGDLRDDVVQALDVLDVDGGVDVDAVATAAPRRRDSAWDGGCRAHWCGRVRRPARSAAGARSSRRGPSRRAPGRDSRSACAACTSSPASSASVSVRPWVSTTPTTTSYAVLEPGAGAAAASRRSCRRRGRRRQRSSACRRGCPRAGPPPAALPARVVKSRRVVGRSSVAMRRDIVITRRSVSPSAYYFAARDPAPDSAPAH